MLNLEQPQVKYLTVSIENVDQRLDNFLLRHLKGLPKSRIYTLIRKGEVRVNKKRKEPAYRLQPSDEIRLPPIRVAAPQKAPMIKKSLEKELLASILYEDDYLLVLNKPANFPVHGGTQASWGVIEAMRHIRPELTLELAHRLDKGTSGCLLLAKKMRVLRDLNQQLQARTCKKQYLAIVKGFWDKNLKECDAPLLKIQSQTKGRFVKVNTEGKNALTRFRVKQYYKRVSFLEVDLLTGRTHQIRVHTAHLMHPIIGDDKYGDFPSNREYAQLGHKRLFLHASYLEFTHPITGDVIKLVAPLPHDFQDFLRFLNNE